LAANKIAFLFSVWAWDPYFDNFLPIGDNGVIAVLVGTCGDYLTYRIDGPKSTFVGYGDLHDKKYDGMERASDFAPVLRNNVTTVHTQCFYDLNLYPSRDMEDAYRSRSPMLYCFAVICIFLFTAGTFLLYDYYVQLRQQKVMLTAKKTTAVVNSLFPKHVRDQILQEVHDQVEKETRHGKASNAGSKQQLRDFLKEITADVGEGGGQGPAQTSIAELFVSTAGRQNSSQ
jgi:hypothetical protein